MAISINQKKHGKKFILVAKESDSLKFSIKEMYKDESLSGLEIGALMEKFSGPKSEFDDNCEQEFYN